MQNEAIKILKQQKQNIDNQIKDLQKEYNSIERALLALEGSSLNPKEATEKPKSRIQKTLEKKKVLEKSSKVPVKKMIIEALSDLKHGTSEQIANYLIKKQNLKDSDVKAKRLRNNITVTSSTLLTSGELKTQSKEGKKNILMLAA